MHLSVYIRCRLRNLIWNGNLCRESPVCFSQFCCVYSLRLLWRLFGSRACERIRPLAVPLKLRCHRLLFIRTKHIPSSFVSHPDHRESSSLGPIHKVALRAWHARPVTAFAKPISKTRLLRHSMSFTKAWRSITETSPVMPATTRMNPTLCDWLMAALSLTRM